MVYKITHGYFWIQITVIKVLHVIFVSIKMDCCPLNSTSIMILDLFTYQDIRFIYLNLDVDNNH